MELKQQDREKNMITRNELLDQMESEDCCTAKDIEIAKTEFDRLRMKTMRTIKEELPILDEIASSNTRAMTIAFIQFCEWLLFLAIVGVVFSILADPQWNPVVWGE